MRMPGWARAANRFLALLPPTELDPGEEDHMPQATCNGTVLTDSDDTVVVEGNHYFPRESLNNEYRVEADTTGRCPWKGRPHYLEVVVDGEINRDAASCYPDPSRPPGASRAVWRSGTASTWRPELSSTPRRSGDRGLSG